MAFSTKTWKNRVAQNINRRKLTDVSTGTVQTVDVERADTPTVAGDLFNAANMNDLETRIKNATDSLDSSVATLNTKVTTNTSDISNLKTGKATQADMTTANNNIATLQSDVRALQSSKAAASEVSSLKTRVANIEGNYATADSYLQFDSRVLALENASTSANSKITALSNRVGALENSVPSSSTMSTLTSDVATLKTTVAKLANALLIDT